jgi:potassium-transporting ATPase potassium-binding subunit
MTMPNINSDAVMFILFFAIVAGVALPFSSLFDHVFTGDVPRNSGSCRKTINLLIGTSLDRNKRQQDYSRDMLIFNGLGLIILLMLLLLQGFLLFNSQNFRIFDLYFAINTAIRFVNITNWQLYSGEMVVSYLTQIVYFTVHNFLSSAAGICISIAVIHEITRQYTDQIGNFEVDIIHSTYTCYIENP